MNGILFFIPKTARARIRAAASIALLLAQAISAAHAQQPAPKAPKSEPALNADEILSEMSRITALPIKAPLKKQRVSKTEIEQYLKENLAAEYTPAEMHGQEAALKAFGLVGTEFDLQHFLVSLYTEQAAGYYDPRRKTMFIADWVEPDQQRMVLAHELTHALQDQSFDLWKFMHASRGDDDATAARQALVEGYATLAMIQAMLGSVPIEKVPALDAMMDQVVNQQMSEYPIFSTAPFFLRFQVLFPYAQGMHFTRAGLLQGGWNRLNESFLHPPVSTKQIFQPDLFFRVEKGSGSSSPLLSLPAPPALESDSALKRVEENSMGELGYYALLGQLVSQAEADKTGKSWNADRYLVYEGPAAGQLALIARTRWQSLEAASAFCDDYRGILEKGEPAAAGQGEPRARAPARARGENSPDLLFETSGPRRSFLQRRGNECRWAQGVPATKTDALAKWFEALP